MIIKYEFVTGETEEIDVPAEFGEFIMVSRREEESAERRHRYHSAYSLDSSLFEDKAVASEKTPESEYLLSEENRCLSSVFETLTVVQRRRLKMFVEGMSYREIAQLEGVDHKQVKKSIEAAQRKISRFILQKTDMSPVRRPFIDLYGVH